MKGLKIKKFFGLTFFLLIIFTLHILNFNNLNTTNSLLQLNGENSSNVLIDNAQKVDVLPDKHGGFFILSEDNYSTKISFLNRSCIESNNSVVSTQINSKYLDVKLFNNDIYLLVVNSENEKQIIKSSFSDGVFYNYQNFYYKFQDESTESSFFIEENTLFFIENGILYSYTIDESPFPDELLLNVNSIFLDYSHKYLYAIKEDGSINFCSVDNIINKDSLGHIEFTNITLNGQVDLKNDPVNFLTDDLFISSTGKILKINMNQGVPERIDNVFTFNVSEISIFNCSTILNFGSKDYLFCKTSANKATLFDIADNNFSKKYSVSLSENSIILNICSSLDNTLLIYKTSEDKYFAKLIGEDDLIEEIDPDPNNPEDPNDPGGNQDPNGSESDKLLGDYKTDHENKYILGVNLGTTVAVFKQNLNLNGEYTVSFKNYTGKEITSGKLGTGSVVSFWKDGKLFKEYTIVVDYDVTGEGNFNSRDLDYICNEIFKNGKTTLSGEYFYSGDMNDDGQIDTLDLLKMKKALN